MGSMALQQPEHTGAVAGRSEGLPQKGHSEGKQAPRTADHMRWSRFCMVDYTSIDGLREGINNN